MKKFLKGSLIIALGDFITKVLSFAYIMYLDRIDATLTGISSALLIPFGFAITLCTLGLTIIMQMDIAKYTGVDQNRVKTSVINASSILMISSIVMSIGMVVYAGYFTEVFASGYTDYYDAFVVNYRIIGFGTIFFAIGTICKSIMIGHGHYKHYSISMILEQFVKLGLTFYYIQKLVVNQSFDTTVILYILSISTLLSIIVGSLYIAIFFFKGRFYTDFFEGQYIYEFKYFRVLVYSGIVYFASSLYMSAFDTFDTATANAMTKFIGDTPLEADVIRSEYMGNSLKLVITPIQLSGAFISVMIKELGDSSSQKRMFSNILKFTFLYSSIMFLLFYILGIDLYNLMFGINSTGIIRVQAFIIPLYCIRNVVAAYYVNSEAKSLHLIISSVLTIGLKFLFNYLLVFLFGINGLVFSSVLSLLIGILYLIFSNKTLFSGLELREAFLIALKTVGLLVVLMVGYNGCKLLFGFSIAYFFIASLIIFILILVAFKKYFIGFLKHH